LGQSRAWQDIRSISVASFLILALAALCGYIFSKPLVFVVAPGFIDTPGIHNLATAFMGLCLFSLPFVAGAAVTSSVLMAEGLFHPLAYSSALFNAVIITAAGIAFAFYGAGHAYAPFILCWGVIAAGIVQWVYQSSFLYRMGFSPIGPFSLSAPETTRLSSDSAWLFVRCGGHQANLLAATFLASFLAEGSVISLYFAERLIGFPLV
jgi:putative peptidoglycan lipid II flippase